MSYIQAFKSTERNEPYGWCAPVVDDHEDKVIDCNLDDEALLFAQELLGQLDSLSEGEVLVIRKVVF